jgi:hypothetical protein
VKHPAFELEGSRERDSIQPGRGGAAGAAKELGPGMCAIFGAWRTEACRLTAQAWAECRERALCAFTMIRMVSGLPSQASGGQMPPALSCRVSHNGRSCSRLGPLKSQNTAGPPTERHVTSFHGKLGGGSSGEIGGVTSAGSVRARPRPPWRRGRVSWSVRGPSADRPGWQGAVHRLALHALHGRAHVLPPASPGQVHQPLLQDALEYQPAVLDPRASARSSSTRK